MSKDIEERDRLYVEELTHSRLRQINRKQNQTFFYCKFTVEDEVEHAIKYNQWRLK